MRNLLGRLRPNLLILVGLLAGIAIVDILNDGTASVGLAAIGALAALGKDLLAADNDRRGE